MIYQEIMASQNFQVLILPGTGGKFESIFFVLTSFGIDFDNSGLDSLGAEDIKRSLTSCVASDDIDKDGDSSVFLRMRPLIRRTAFIPCSLTLRLWTGFSNVTSKEENQVCLSNAISDHIIHVFLRHQLSAWPWESGGYMQCLGWYQNYPTCSPSPHCTVC